MLAFRRISLTNTTHQYFIGLAVNILFLALLYSFPASFYNTRIPVNEYAQNIYRFSDVMTYVRPALNFLHTGVFGTGNVPDHFRTIGYPYIISLFIQASPSYWLLWLQLFNCLVFASLYPAISLISSLLFKDLPPLFYRLLFIFSLVSGIFFTRVPCVLSDLLFTTLFLWGVYYILYATIHNKWHQYLFYMLFITVAALIRPTLSVFPVIGVVLMLHIAAQRKIAFRARLIPAVISCTILLASCNISTFRNYVNYHFLSPSSVVGINVYVCFGKKVLKELHREAEADSITRAIGKAPDISEVTRLRKEAGFRILLQHPLQSAKVLSLSTMSTLLDNHLVNTIFNYFGYSWKPYFYSEVNKYKSSAFCYYATYLLMAVYVLIWLIFLKGIFRLLAEKHYYMLVFAAYLFVMFIIPAIITGDGGSRFRLTFDWFLHILVIRELVLLLPFRKRASLDIRH